MNRSGTTVTQTYFSGFFGIVEETNLVRSCSMLFGNLSFATFVLINSSGIIEYMNKLLRFLIC
uniref:Uncharacterized protein n=1 Tax=Ciona intestinalis TaxID=7719 RepID=H2Y0Q4_CIOIN